MSNRNKQLRGLLAVVTAGFICAAVQAQMIPQPVFSNTDYIGKSHGQTGEYGNAVVLDPLADGPTIVTDIVIGYYTPLDFVPAGASMTFRAYLMDGPEVPGFGPSPGTELLEVAGLGLGQGAQTMTITQPELPMVTMPAASLAFTAEWVGTTDAELLQVGNAAVGGYPALTEGMYWRRVDGGDWETFLVEDAANPGTFLSANFYIEVLAIPEPSTLFSLLAGLGVLGMWTLRRRV